MSSAKTFAYLCSNCQNFVWNLYDIVCTIIYPRSTAFVAVKCPVCAKESCWLSLVLTSKGLSHYQLVRNLFKVRRKIHSLILLADVYLGQDFLVDLINISIQFHNLSIFYNIIMKDALMNKFICTLLIQIWKSFAVMVVYNSDNVIRIGTVMCIPVAVCVDGRFSIITKI